jgi:phage/plasmid-associated DNA primase
MTHPSIDYLRRLFGPATLQPVFLCSLVNDKAGSDAGVRSIHSRDHQAIFTFVNRWNRPGRGLYYCMSTIGEGKPRNKDNCLETPAFVIDVDFKDIDCSPAAAENLIKTLRLPPTGVIRTGHGLHVVWMLKEALATHEFLSSIETVLRQLCDVIGGDLAVAHPAALLRLPGSHNSKNGEWTEVEVVSWADRFYELDDIEEWLSEQSIVIKRKTANENTIAAQRSEDVPGTNPYLEFANQIGWKPPIDVAQRLEQMRYMGPGDTGIFRTQTQVCGRMVHDGVAENDIFQAIMVYTHRAAGGHGANWNWAKEEKRVRKLIAWTQEKHGVIQQDEEVPGIIEAPLIDISPETSEGLGEEQKAFVEGNIVNLKEVREKVATKLKAVAQHSKKKFKVVSEAVKAKLAGHLLFDEKHVAWGYADGLWSPIDNFKDWIDIQTQDACNVLAIVCDNRLASEVRGDISRDPALQRSGLPWDQHGKVPARNGLVDPATLELSVASPEHYCTWRLACDFVVDADRWMWRRMLHDCFVGHADCIDSLQELLGCALVDHKPRGLQRALILHGGKNCGKSALLEVFKALFGGAISVSIDSVDGAHGLMPFRQRLPWIVSEAFQQNVWHASATVKTLITGESVPVNIKNGPIVSVRWLGPVFWASNHPVQFRESTEAIVSRIVPIACKAAFDDEHLVGVALWARDAGFSGPAELIVARELEGVLAWALEGLRGALKRGSITLGEESREEKKSIYRDANLMRGFIEDCVHFTPNWRVSRADFYLAAASWFAATRGESNRPIPSNDSFGRALTALHEERVKRHKSNGVPYIGGVELNEEGVKYFEHGKTARIHEGRTVGISMDHPNKPWVAGMHDRDASDDGRRDPDGSAPF